MSLKKIKNISFLKGFLALVFGVLFFGLMSVKPVLAIDGLMNGKTITGETDDYLFWLQSYDSATTPFYFDRFFVGKNGNVGIGITNPGAKLQINPGTNTEGLRIITSNYSPFVIRNAANTADIFRIDQNGNITGGIGNSSAWTRNDAAGQLYVSNINDKVGIGITNPITPLNVIGKWQYNNAGAIYSQDNSYSLDLAGINVDSLKVYKDIYSTAGVLKTDGTGNSYVMGNLGIGTTTPNSKLDVMGSLSINGKNILSMPSNNPETGAWNPIWTAIGASKPLYFDEEFANGSNGVNIYNNSGGTAVTITRLTDQIGIPNSTGSVLKISYDGVGAVSPGFGGFYLSFTPAANRTYVQRFRAKVPVGKNLVLAENSQGDNATSYWLTNTAGTGKWEDYIRISHAGNSGSFAGSGHVYITGGSGAFDWYLSSINIYEVNTPIIASPNTWNSAQTFRGGALFPGSGIWNVWGSVGIGTTAPLAKLQINPGTNTEGLRIITSNYSPFVIRNASDTADIFRIDQNGNITGGIGNSSAWTRNNATSQLYVSNVNDKVGIGTSNPFLGQLHVNKDTAAGLGGDLWITNNAVNTTGNSARLSFGLDNTTDVFSNAFIQAIVTNSSGYLTDLTFGTYGTGNLAERMRINSSGNVGIGNNLNLTAGGTIFNSNSTRWLDMTGTNADSLRVPGNIRLGDAARNVALGLGTNVANRASLTLNSTAGNPADIIFKNGSATIGNYGQWAISSRNGSNDYRFSIWRGSENGGVSTESEMFTISPSGNVGIGTTAPRGKLHISSLGDSITSIIGVEGATFDLTPKAVLSFRTRDISTDVGSSVEIVTGRDADYTGGGNRSANLQFWVENSDALQEKMRITSAGSVGIGTDAPTKKLDVAGDLLVRNAATFNSSITATSLSGTAGRILAVDASGTFYATSSSIATGLPSPSGISGQTLRSNGTNWIANSLLYNNGTNVGINTTAPAGRLHVNDGAVIIDKDYGIRGDGFNSGARNFIWSLSNSYPDRGISYFEGSYDYISIHPGSIASVLAVTDTGNVGIGTTTPSASLDIFGNFKITSGGLVYNTNSSYRFNFSDIFGDHNSLIAQGDINTAGVLETAGTDRPNYMLGKLGIGITNPQHKLEIAGSDVNSFEAAGFYNTYAYGLANKAESRINIGKIEGNTKQPMGSIGAFPSSADSSGQGVLVFYTRLSQTMNERMRINSSGSVGIGTTAPGAAYKLDVAGKINTSGGVAGGFCIGGDCIDSWGDVIGTFNSSTPLTVGNLTVSTIVMDQSGGLGNILNVRKLTVGTIDPLYRIDGTNYSSFAAAIVGGVKEEYLGRVKISKLNDAKEYEYRLDFAKLSAPDELWVWRQTVDFSPENVEVNITPYGAFASTYYIIEDEAIIFRADKPITVSYRLAGKRLDWQNWPTEAKDQQEKPSFIINNKKLIK